MMRRITTWFGKLIGPDLKTRITVAVSGLVVLLMAAMAVGTLSYYEKQLRATISRDQSALLTIISHEIDGKLEAARQLLIVNARAIPPQALVDVEAAQRFLDSRASLLHVFDNHIGLFTPAGTEITESPLIRARRGRDYSYRSYIKGTVATGRPYITDPFISSQAHHHPVIMMTAPVFDRAGRMVAILAGSLDLMQSNLLGGLTAIPVGRTGYLYLTTADRTIIMHPRKELIFRKIEPGVNNLYDRVIDEGFEGTGRTLNGFQSGMLTTFKRLRTNNWVLASNYPVAEAYAPLRQMERSFLCATALGVVVLVIILVPLIRHFTAPLASFTRHVQELPRKQGSGRMIDPLAGGEIGTLSKAFNSMVAELDAQQSALRESEQRFRELADSLPQTVFEMDLQGKFTYVNRTALDAFGYEQEDVGRGIFVQDMIAPGDRERALRNIASLLRGEPPRNEEYLALRKDGTAFPCVVHAGPVMRDGAVAGLRGIVVDITERKRAESEFLKMQKLESIGVLAGGIAHDFNNILTGILGNLSLAKMRLRPDDPLYHRIDETEKASLQARDLTQQLLTFARGGNPVKKVVSAELLIRDTATFATRGTNVKTDLRFASGLRPIVADEGQMGQVFHNLVINACQAMPNGGIVRISAENLRLDMGRALPLSPGEYVRVKVEDQGIGIPAEYLPKVFDPYFTTKRQGSGLGLAVAYSVVKSHGGHLEVASTPGSGTVFTLYLPASTEEIQAEAESGGRIVEGRGRILVMDDEEIVRKVVKAILAELGYEAEFADDGRKAVARYIQAREEGRAFDAVIMDLTVPGGMGGRDAVRELLAADPGARAIVSSGYSTDPVMADFRAFGFRGYVKKPFKVQELSEALSHVLHEAG